MNISAESFKKLAESVASTVGDSSNAEGPPPDFQVAINQALKDLSATSENLQVRFYSTVLIFT